MATQKNGSKQQPFLTDISELRKRARTQIEKGAVTSDYGLDPKQAIDLLQPVEADSSVRQVLHTVASEDDNPHIRTVSQKVLDQPLQIQ